MIRRRGYVVSISRVAVLVFLCLSLSGSVVVCAARDAETAERYYKIGADNFYNFEFGQALETLKAALELAEDRSAALEYRYWVSKVLWVYLLDQQIDINEDFMTVVLDKDLTKQPRIDSPLRREFFDVTRGGT